MPEGPPLGGLLVVDKPGGMTSHDVVARIRRLAGTRRVGHAGTLDPAATGVLVIGVDWSTRLLTFLSGHDKSYSATIRFGRSTVTDDAEGETLDRADAGAVAAVTDARVAAAVADLTGPLEQVPSAVSAVKVAGRRAYTRVRAGESVVLAPRSVSVSRFDVTALRRGHDDAGGGGQAGAGQDGAGQDGAGQDGGDAWAEVDIEVDVSAGTYVRALARDLGRAVGTGAHLTSLRRTRSGPFTLADAAPLVRLEGTGALAGRLLPPSSVVDRFLPSVAVDDDTAARIRYGQRIAGHGTGQGVLAVRDGARRLVAVVDDTGAQLRLLVVAPTG